MLSFVVLALAAASASAHSMTRVRHHHVPRAQPPAGWATSYLEAYDVYHTRYEAIGCGNKHDTPFFDICCHPLLATETVKKNRPACCAVGATVACPGTVASSAAAPAKTPAKAPAKTPTKTPAKAPTKTPAKTPAKTTAAPAVPAKTTAAQDDGDDCDDGDDYNDTTGDDDEDCDDEE